MPAMPKRKAAVKNGGNSRTAMRMAKKVLPHNTYIAANANASRKSILFITLRRTNW
jgi:hypothetical protein